MPLDPRAEYFRTGAGQEILRRALEASRPPSGLDAPPQQNSNGQGGLLGGLLKLAGNLDRPAGAVRAGLQGHNPIAGFKDPQDYSFIDPNASFGKQLLQGGMEAALDPLNIIGAGWLSPLKGASFAARLAGETGINVAARTASSSAAHVIPEDANPWVKGLVPLAAGAVGGGITAGGLARAGRGAEEGARTGARPFTTLQDQAFGQGSFGEQFGQGGEVGAVPGRTRAQDMAAARAQYAAANGGPPVDPNFSNPNMMHIDHVREQVGYAQEELAAAQAAGEEGAALAESKQGLRYWMNVESKMNKAGSQWIDTSNDNSWQIVQPPKTPPSDVGEQMAMDFPGANFAAHTTPIASTIDEAIAHQETNSRIAAVGENAPKLREASDTAAQSGLPAPTMPLTPTLHQTVDDTIARLDHANLDPQANDGFNARQLKLAEDARAIAKDRVDNMQKKITVPGMPGWAAQVINGKINRDPRALVGAMTGHTYLQGQMVDIAAQTHDVGNVAKDLFGESFDKVSIKPEAPQGIRNAWVRAQSYTEQAGGGQYGHLPMGLITREPDMFNLSPAQREFIDTGQDYLHRDNNLTNTFGVKTPELEHNYDVRAQDIKHGDGSDLTPEEHIRLLGGLQSFQQHRVIDHPADLIMAMTNPDYFKSILKNMISKTEDPAEVQSLTDMLNSDLKLVPKPVTYVDALADRLSQAAASRSEALALKTVRDNGGGLDEIHEMDSLIGSHKISEAIGLPARAAAFLRQVTLSADMSTIGTHTIGSLVMGGGIKGTIGAYLKAISSEEGFSAHMAANVDKYMDGAMHGLELGTPDFAIRDVPVLNKAWNVGQHFITDPVTGKKTALKAGGFNANLPGRAISKLDEIQFDHVVKYMKGDTYQHISDLLIAARDGNETLGQVLGHPGVTISRFLGRFKGLSDDQLKTSAAAFTNNLFGGLNRVAGGRTAAHDMMESLFILTPGFTRGTMAIGTQALNPLRWDAEAALARDFAVRGLVTAATVMTGISMIVNGTDAPLPNVTDPSKSDWMTLKFGDKTIAPLSRWRSTGKIAGTALMTMADAGPIEAAQYFGPAAIKWGAARQGGLITATMGDPIGDFGRAQLGQPNIGNSYAQGMGLKDIALNPDVQLKNQIGGAISRNLLPSTAQQALQTYRDDGSLTGSGLRNVAFTIASEFLGVNSNVQSPLTTAIGAHGAEYAAAHGMDPQVIQNAVDTGKNPINAKDAQGRYLLDSATRKAGAEALAAQLGVPVDQIYKNGVLTDREKQSSYDAIKHNQIKQFSDGMGIANDNYATQLAKIQAGIDAGVISYPQASKLISDARTKRAAEKGMVEGLSPAALAFFQSPDQLAKQNSKDVLNSAIAAEYFSKDFIDPQTLTFDFKAQSDWQQELRLKYGKNFDNWMAIADSKKTPLELSRDKAFKRLDTYFNVGDDVWQRVTGGALGNNEADFDKYLTGVFKDAGVTDPSILDYIVSQAKSQMKPVTQAHSITNQLRDVMRAADPQLESDVTTWLGAQPIALVHMSKARRATINGILSSSS